MSPQASVLCDYCGQQARLVTGAELYPHLPRLSSLKLWRCVPCGAHVGCHKGTERPMGRLANAELRIAKMAAHAAFDPLWKVERMRRSEAYRWLSEQLGIHWNDCHIGMFDVAQCEQVVAACVRRCER